jgi:hypothetical protein
MPWINRARRALIRLLIGRMEVCCNMTINGDCEYNGRHGGVICEGNRFISRSQGVASEAA